MAPPTLRPRSVTELVDASFGLLRQHYAECVAAAAIFFVPAVLLQLALPLEHWRMGQLVVSAASVGAEGAVIVVASDAYLGRRVSVEAAALLAARRWLPMLAAFATQMLATLLGLLLLVVPGLFAFAWTYAMTPVIVLEGARVGESLRRSDRLSSEQIGRILGTAGIASIVAYLLTTGAGLLASWASQALGLDEWRVVVAATDVATVLAYPILYVLTALLYYDLRIRKEGFDLELLAEALGPPAPPPDRS